MTITFLRTTDGKPVPRTEALDEHGVLKDGHMMRNNVMLMDGASAPLGRSVPLTDADKDRRRAQIAAYDERVSNAWRAPPPLVPDQQKQEKAPPKDVGDAYARYDARISDAWR